MKKIMKAAVAATLMLSMTACGSSDGTSGANTKVGIIQLAEHPALDASYEGFMDALNEAGYTEENTLTIRMLQMIYRIAIRLPINW
mgnify:CR=1 FL=1